MQPSPLSLLRIEDNGRGRRRVEGILPLRSSLSDGCYLHRWGVGGSMGRVWIATCPARHRVDHYCTSAEKEVTLEGDGRHLFDARTAARCSCVLGKCVYLPPLRLTENS